MDKNEDIQSLNEQIKELKKKKTDLANNTVYEAVSMAPPKK